MSGTRDAAGAPAPLLAHRDAVAIIVGIVIGAGIFKTPSMVAGVIGDPGWAIAAWVAGALVSLAGALCYAELASAYPHAGGDYHFLTRAYGRNASFLYAWARGTVINPGAIALLAFVFGDYVSTVLPLGRGSGAIWAALAIVALTLVNLWGLRISAGTQALATVLLVAGLAAIAATGFALSPAETPPPSFASRPAPGLFGLAMVFVLLTYGGWNEAAYISAELKDGRRAIVAVLVTSLAIIAIVYLGVNVALLHALGVKALAGSKAPGAELMGRALGSFGSGLVATIVSLAVLTSINATMIVGARTNYAMARDWPALRFMAGWHVARGTPSAAFVVQAAISLALVAFGAAQPDGFEAMVQFTAPVFWSFLFLVGVALFRMRAIDGDAERPFRVPWYPLTPLVFCAACLWLAYSSIAYAASQNAVHVSLLVMAAGAIAWIATRAHAAARRAR